MSVQWIMDPLCRLLRRKTSHKWVNLIQSSAAIFKYHNFSLFRPLFQLSLLIGRFYWLFTDILSCAFPVLPCVLRAPWPWAGFIHVRNNRRSIEWELRRHARSSAHFAVAEVRCYVPLPCSRILHGTSWSSRIPPSAGCKSLAFIKCTDVSLFCSFQMPGLSRTGCTQKVSLKTSNEHKSSVSGWGSVFVSDRIAVRCSRCEVKNEIFVLQGCYLALIKCGVDRLFRNVGNCQSRRTVWFWNICVAC